MEAIVGVPLTPSRFLAVLAGCVTESFDVTRAARHGSLLTIETLDARVHIVRAGAGWRVKAGETPALLVEFGTGPGALPGELWLWSRGGPGPQASLHVTVADPEFNPTVPARLFQVPAGAAAATPMTLEELRATAPWRNRGLVPID